MEPKAANPKPATPTTITRLIHEVGEWANRNFRDQRCPEMGVVEELGEAVHCCLKRKQKIRGFDNDEHFGKHFGDALADTIIYLADWCHIHNAFFEFGRNTHAVGEPTPEMERRVITHLLQAASQMMAFEEINPTGSYKVSVMEEGVYNMTAQRIASGIEFWAKIYNLDIRFLVSTTWARVSQRDWVQNPQGPDEVTGQSV